MSAAARYTQTQTLTSSKERVLVLLVRAAEKNMHQAMASFHDGEPAKADVFLRKASDIVWELQRTLDPGPNPELAQNLADLYVYVGSQLLAAQLQRAAAPVDNALRAFSPIADAFAAAVEQVTGGAP